MYSAHEDPIYKHDDHQFRSVDEYAQGKYTLTTRWLRPLAKPGELLLNIGCGGGEYNAIASALGLRVIACEPEAQAFALAADTAPPAVEVRQCGLLELESEPASYIVMHDVLEHIEDDRGAVERVHALLRPGGVAIISVPAYQWLFGRHDVQLGHYRRYTRHNLTKLFAAGFEVEAARYYGASFIPVALWFSRLSQKPYPVAAAGRGFTRQAMHWVCQLESRVPMPVGTSVLVRVRKLG
jgi:2-polyprenyl-3-methyl-5-hydroxy-6-metoxy-1,4-benzoquinol methylase